MSALVSLKNYSDSHRNRIGLALIFFFVFLLSVVDYKCS